MQYLTFIKEWFLNFPVECVMVPYLAAAVVVAVPLGVGVLGIRHIVTSTQDTCVTLTNNTRFTLYHLINMHTKHTKKFKNIEKLELCRRRFSVTFFFKITSNYNLCLQFEFLKKSFEFIY